MKELEFVCQIYGNEAKISQNEGINNNRFQSHLQP